MTEEHEFVRVKSRANDTEQIQRTATLTGKYVNYSVSKTIMITSQWEGSSWP